MKTITFFPQLCQTQHVLIAYVNHQVLAGIDHILTAWQSVDDVFQVESQTVVHDHHLDQILV